MSSIPALNGSKSERNNGGLALLWNDEVSLVVKTSSSEYIDVICKEPSSGREMRIHFLACLHELHGEITFMAAVASH